MTNPHARTQIRNALATLLTGLTTTGPRVFKSRTWPTRPGDYPALLIYAQGGASSADDEGDVQVRQLERVERLVVEGLVRVTGEEPDDLLDAIALEVERQVATDETLGDLVDPMELQATALNVALHGEARIGVVKLSFAAVCRTSVADPSNVVTNN